MLFAEKNKLSFDDLPFKYKYLLLSPMEYNP